MEDASKRRKRLLMLHQVAGDLDAALQGGDAKRITRFSRMFNKVKRVCRFARLREETGWTLAQAAERYHESPEIWIGWERTNKPDPRAYAFLCEVMLVEEYKRRKMEGEIVW